MLLFRSSDNPEDEQATGHLNGDADGHGAYRGITNVLVLSLLVISGVVTALNLLDRFT